MQNSAKVKSLVRAFSILECFTAEEPKLGISEISERMGMNKSTIYNVLATLHDLKYIEKDPTNDKYYLGKQFLQFSHIINTQIGITEELIPYLLKIADQTNETVFMGIPDGKKVLYLYSCQNNVALRRNNIMGETAPMYCTGLGKAMLAKLKDKVEIDVEDLVKYTEKTITDLNELNAELDIIRAQGYAFDNMEHEYGVRCVGVAICDLSGNAVAGISVSGPSLRFEGDTPKEIANIIKQVLKPLNHYIL